MTSRFGCFFNVHLWKLTKKIASIDVHDQDILGHPGDLPVSRVYVYEQTCEACGLLRVTHYRVKG